MDQNTHKKKKIAAMADLHITETSQGQYKQVFEEISELSNILALCGDLTDLGKESEAEILRDELRACRIPVVAVLGNHDYESDQEKKVRDILVDDGIHVLGQEPVTIDDVGFAGVKGFGGGYERYSLGSFGEQPIKTWVNETVQEVFSLENQLQQLTASKKVVLMHYSPIRDTLVGESEEIYSFLGSSRFAEPIENFDVDLALHGHAHHGTYSGKTAAKQIPVYNVSIPVLTHEKNMQYAVFTL